MERTIDRINQLSVERGRLYREATNGHRGDPDVLSRVHALDDELQRLWDTRRQERAGRRDGIDLFVDKVYEEAYGRGYEDAVSPPTVAEAADQAA